MDTIISHVYIIYAKLLHLYRDCVANKENIHEFSRFEEGGH